MVLAPVPPTPPAPSVPRRPTAPVPTAVTTFAARLDRAAGRVGGAALGPDGAATDVGATRSHAQAAMTLGTMLRAGLSTSPMTSITQPAVPLRAVAAAVAATSTASAGVAPGATVAEGAGALAGRLVVQPVEGRVTSTFGPRVHPIHGGVRDHHGLDLAAPTGTPVRAVTDGTVVRVGDAGGYGLLVEVDHGDGITSRYAHLSAIDVAVGDVLDAGQRLGAVGSTGASTGPHLHLEVRVDGAPVDPQHALATV